MSDARGEVRRNAVAVAASLPSVSLRPVAVPPDNPVPFWCFMVFTFVLFISPQALVPGLASLPLAKLAVGVATVAYLADRLLNGRPITITSPEILLAGAFTFLAVLSIPLSLAPGASIGFFFGTFVKSVITFLLIANVVDRMDRLRALIALIVAAGVVYSATGVYNFAAGHTMASRGEPDRPLGYPSPLALNPDDLGLVLNVILALTAGVYVAARRPLVKRVLGAAMLLMIGGIIASFSRGAFLALAATLAVLLVQSVRARGALVLLPACALLVLGFLVVPAGYADRLYSLVDPSLDRVGSISKRWAEVKVSFTAIVDNPLLGAGVGQDGLVYVQQGFGHGWETHNIFLQVGADLGLAGLVVYGLLIFHVLRGLRTTRALLRAHPGAHELVALAGGVELAVWSWLVGAFFLSVPYDFTFFYLAGLAVAIRVLGVRLLAAARRVA